MILIRSDYSDVDEEFDRLEAMPTTRMHVALDQALDVGFETARGMVHVQTGRLKASGKKSTKATKNSWSGKFSFPAKNSEGVSYGMYERERGGDHDFFSQVFLIKGMLRAALLSGLRRNK